MDLERLFYRWYKKICLDTQKEQFEDRWAGIENAAEYSWSEERVSELIKLYYKLPSKTGIKAEFVEFFSDIDKGFDDNNDEEISILAGSVLACLLQEKNDLFIALCIQVLEPYFEIRLKELSDLADSVIVEMSKESHINTSETKPIEQISPEWEAELTDNGQLSENAAVVLVDIIKILQSNLEVVCKRNEILQDENQHCYEKTQILSWIIGEWSDILGAPLSEVLDVNASIVLGVELASLVKVYPGPYAAEAFLIKMLSKCKKREGEKTVISLTNLIDNQETAIKEEIIKRYGENCETRILPILSALKCSLSVDDKRTWIPIYKKAWKINPDDIELELATWAKLIYQECMANNY